MAGSMNTALPMRPISLIGAPADVGAGVRGASLGPEALRVAGLVQALRRQGLRVEDRGDLVGPVNPMHPAHAGCRHLQQVHVWTRLVADAVQASLAWGQVPVLLGGDHSLAMGSIAAVARHCAGQGKRLQVVWLDAHADCNTPATSPTGNLHGMPLACLLGQGPDVLTGPAPVLHPDQVWLMGLRSTDPGEELFLQSMHIRTVRLHGGADDGGQVVDALAHWLAGLDGDTHVHLSLDLDVLDPLLAPGVSTPAAGGLNAAQAMACMRLLGQDGRVGSVDLVELNPARDVRHQTARLAVALLTHLLAPAGQNTQSRAEVISR